MASSLCFIRLCLVGLCSVRSGRRREVIPAELPAGLRAEDLLIGGALGLHALVLLIEVDQEIRLHQDL